MARYSVRNISNFHSVLIHLPSNGLDETVAHCILVKCWHPVSVPLVIKSSLSSDAEFNEAGMCTVGVTWQNQGHAFFLPLFISLYLCLCRLFSLITVKLVRFLNNYQPWTDYLTMARNLPHNSALKSRTSNEMAVGCCCTRRFTAAVA